MTICFVANNNKTYFFDSIAEILSCKYNIKVCWIVVNCKNNDFLERKYPKEQILYLKKEVILKASNKKIGDYKLNELVINDRTLKYNYTLGISILTNIQLPIFQFLKSNGIKFVFGELTWAHEILIKRITEDRKDLECKYLNPHTCRIPYNRFVFFEDEFQSKIHIVNSNYQRLDEVDKYFTLIKPDYLSLNNNLLKKRFSLRGRLIRLINFLRSSNFDKNDITHFSRFSFQRVFLPVSQEFNKESYRLVEKKGIDFLKNKDFVFVTLHKQPEASVDVLGRYFEDQYQNIVNLWKLLPSDWYLIIKEHTNAIGDRSLFFYNKLLKFHNVFFVDENIDSYCILPLSKAVFTISGTIAYEAAIYQKPAFTLSPVFFKFSKIKELSIDDFRYKGNLKEIINEVESEVRDDQELKKLIYYNSFPGKISDPISDSSCMDDDNILMVSTALARVCEVAK